MTVIAQFEAQADLTIVEGFTLKCDPAPAPDACFNLKCCFDEIYISYKNSKAQHTSPLISPVCRATYRDLANYRLPPGKRVLLGRGEVFFVECVKKNIKFTRVEFKPVVSNLKNRGDKIESNKDILSA